MSALLPEVSDDGKELAIELLKESRGALLRKRLDDARQARIRAVDVYHLIKPGIVAEQTAAKTRTARHTAKVKLAAASAPLDLVYAALKAVEREIIQFEKDGGVMENKDEQIMVDDNGSKKNGSITEDKKDDWIEVDDMNLVTEMDELANAKLRTAEAEKLRDEELKKRVILVTKTVAATKGEQLAVGGGGTEQDVTTPLGVDPDPTQGIINLQNALTEEAEKRLCNSPAGLTVLNANVQPPKKKRVVKDEDDDEASKKFVDMTPEEQGALQKQGELAVAAFLKTGTVISFRIRRYIRESQEFLPQAATSSRKLALHIFETNRGSTICIFHQRHRSFNQHDGYNGKYVMKGVTYPKLLNTTSAKHTPHVGHLHCGCETEVALMGFFFWKTWTLTSPHPKLKHLTESMRDEDLQPRSRGFIVEAYQKVSYLTLDDIYDSNWGSADYDDQIRLHQITNIIQQMNISNRQRGLPEKRLIDVAA